MPCVQRPFAGAAPVKLPSFPSFARVLARAGGGGRAWGSAHPKGMRLAENWLPGRRTGFAVAARGDRGTFRSGRERACNLESRTRQLFRGRPKILQRRCGWVGTVRRRGAALGGAVGGGFGSISGGDLGNWGCGCGNVLETPAIDHKYFLGVLGVRAVRSRAFPRSLGSENLQKSPKIRD